jgi:probable phosphoglycerate mutase
MSTLYLVRHGENRANLTKEFSCRRVDYPLTDKGRLQARQTADHFVALSALSQARPLQAVYTSPLKRAAETAEVIAGALGLRAQVSEYFRELDVGDLEATGGSAEGWQIHNLVWEAWFRGSPETSFPGGENLLGVVERMRLGVHQLLEEQDGKDAILVGHGGLFTASIQDLCPRIEIAWLLRQDQQNCSISELAMYRQNGRWLGELVRWGDVSHLSGEAARLVSARPAADR